VPFTLVHAGKYRTEDKLRTDTTKTKYDPEKSKQHKIQQNITTLVQSPLTTLGKETRWTYSRMLLSPHRSEWSGKGYVSQQVATID